MLVDSSNIRSQPQPDASDLYFVDFMKSVEELHQEQSSTFNDAIIICGQGISKKEYRIPGVILASISPVFKVSEINSWNGVLI